jgi:squalene monooxygenase
LDNSLTPKTSTYIPLYNQLGPSTGPQTTAKMLTMFSGTKIAGLPPSVTASPPPQQLRARGTSTASIRTTDSSHKTDSRERRRLEHHEADIVIVGAGIVGCAAAVAFGKQGRSVILLEKSWKQPDRIVGELLQPGGVNALEKLGMRGTNSLNYISGDPDS